jgi:NOL1/NOP2/fmu family ribosome biogenesis protein
MDIIKVSRTHLLETLKQNRTAHSEEYALAEKGYWLRVEEALKLSLKEIRKNGTTNLGKFYQLQAPQDHTKDYDVVITMMEYSVEDVIELDHTRFQQYVMDNWSWTNNVKSLNTLYAASVAGASK